MKWLQIMTAVVLVGLTSTPAFALFCVDTGPEIGLDIEIDNGPGPFRPRTRDLQAELDLQRLRSVGVYANSTERWNGCIRAYVKQANGGESMEFYDPNTLRRVQ